MVPPKIPAQPADKRTKNFSEVSLGLSKKQALEEARRCPQCASPTCLAGCPLGIDIPGFIRQIRENEPARALAKIKENNLLASICGRLCPAPCERACIFYEDGAPIAIRALERFAADFGQIKALKPEGFSSRGKKVAVVGSGPAGLTVAGILAQKGFPVTVFESLPESGGVLRYGVPEFRFPKKILDSEIFWLKSLGVSWVTNFIVGQSAGLKELLSSGFSAVFAATGAGAVKFLEISGTNLGGVLYAEEFLMRLNLANSDSRAAAGFHIGNRVAVVGRGYAAIDCARAVVRLGRQATVIFEHSEDDSVVRLEDKEYGKEEGLQLEPLTKPLQILGDDRGFVCGIKCQRLDFADAENSGQWKLVEVPSSEFVVDTDTVIIAAGHQPNSVSIRKTPDLKINSDGSVWTNESDCMTSLCGIFAGGSAVTGNTSVVQAMADGKKAAEAIERYLKR